MFDPATWEYEIRKEEPALSVVVVVVCVCAIKYSDLRPPRLVPPNWPLCHDFIGRQVGVPRHKEANGHNCIHDIIWIKSGIGNITKSYLTTFNNFDNLTQIYQKDELNQEVWSSDHMEVNIQTIWFSK